MQHVLMLVSEQHPSAVRSLLQQHHGCSMVKQSTVFGRGSVWYGTCKHTTHKATPGKVQGCLCRHGTDIIPTDALQSTTCAYKSIRPSLQHTRVWRRSPVTCSIQNAGMLQQQELVQGRSRQTSCIVTLHMTGLSPAVITKTCTSVHGVGAFLCDASLHIATEVCSWL